jgi:hypothetical protein
MRIIIALVLLVLATVGWAAEPDPCAAASTVSDVQFTLALKDHAPVFQEGEIIPLALSFSSSVKGRYSAHVRTYDRSGRLGIDHYCVEPHAPDPLEAYFKVGMFMGGGLGGIHVLDATPLTADAELNEWRSLRAGHYRVDAVTSRIWRQPDPNDPNPNDRPSTIVRSNTIEFDVKAADPEWQTEQLRSAVQTLAASPTPDEAKHAGRRLRFLNSRESTRQLAKLYCGLIPQPSNGFDLMAGLFGSPYRQLAIDVMHAELAAPDHPITSEFLHTLVNLQITGDPNGTRRKRTPRISKRPRRSGHSDRRTRAN